MKAWRPFAFIWILTLWSAPVLTGRVASAQSDPAGYQALLASFSAAGLPAPGTGVVVEQVEAPEQIIGSTFYYLPDATQIQFTHVNITPMISGGTSTHATLVANRFYGNGYASGISQVDVYEANYWVDYILRTADTYDPAAAPTNNPAVANFS